MKSIKFSVAIFMLGVGSGIAQERALEHPMSRMLEADPAEIFDRFLNVRSPADTERIEQVEISWRDERRIGERGIKAFLAQLEQQGVRVIRQGSDVDYLRALVATIQPSMRNARRYRSIHVLVADSDDPDARSFPGGWLVFYRGLLDFVDNEAALVGVVGHELSHLDHGHQLYDAKRLQLMSSSVKGKGGISLDQFFENGMFLARSFTRPFRPEEESAADQDGTKWSFSAGYDPQEMAKLFLKMHRRERAKPDWAPNFLRSHPYHIDRFEAVKTQVAELQQLHPQQELYVGSKNLAARIPLSDKRFQPAK